MCPVLLCSGNQTFCNLCVPPLRINIYYSQPSHGHVRLYMERGDNHQVNVKDHLTQVLFAFPDMLTGKT